MILGGGPALPSFGPEGGAGGLAPSPPINKLTLLKTALRYKKRKK